MTSLTQFAMIEELASLVKDNLPCKHLVLSIEEEFVNFLQDETCLDGFLELEPMNSYNRLLVHRLADIFGFAHESIGEGDDRHLILERCADTAIPSVLVSDIVWSFDESEPVTTFHQFLRREVTPSALVTNLPSPNESLEERKAKYYATRKKIFSTDVEDTQIRIKQRPRPTIDVAQRMITHALGKNVNQQKHDLSIEDPKLKEGQSNDIHVDCPNKVEPDSSSRSGQNTLYPSSQALNSISKKKSNTSKHITSAKSKKSVSQESTEKSSTNANSLSSGRSRNTVNRDNLKEEHMGAAKRIFANALGLQPAKPKTSVTNPLRQSQS